MLSLLRLVSVAAVVLALAGCGGDSPEPEASGTGSDAAPTEESTTAPEGVRLPNPTGWSTPAEMRWLKEFGSWAKAFNGDLGDLESWIANKTNQGRIDRGDESAVVDFEYLLEPIRECAATFEERVPAPPTERVERGATYMLDGCKHYAEGAETLLEGVREKDVDTVQSARSQMIEAVESVSKVNEVLPPGEARRVPTRSSPGGRTRIDPRYSDVAETIAEKETEVRCWSDRDWRRVLREENAMTGLDLTPDTLGVTGLGSKRVNLGPITCQALDDLAYRDKRPTDPDGMLLVSYALTTLAHEVQHRNGVFDEAAAECLGIQHAPDTARALGIDKAYTEALLATYWAEYDELEEIYRSPECKRGGELDAQVSSAIWP